jgi:hypothetical protein
LGPFIILLYCCKIGRFKPLLRLCLGWRNFERECWLHWFLSSWVQIFLGFWLVVLLFSEFCCLEYLFCEPCLCDHHSVVLFWWILGRLCIGTYFLLHFRPHFLIEADQVFLKSNVLLLFLMFSLPLISWRG